MKFTKKTIQNAILESSKYVREKNNIDIDNNFGFKKLLLSDEAYEDYKYALLENYKIQDEEMRDEMDILLDNTREALLEMTTYALNPYESLVPPMIPIFYPKLAAREAVTTTPVDMPEVIRSFLVARFIDHEGNVYDAPSEAQRVSFGPTIGVDSVASMAVPSEKDILAVKSLDPTVAHLEKDFEIQLVSDGTNTAAVSIKPSVDGYFAASVVVNGVPDMISGMVDFKNGIVKIASHDGVVSSVNYKVTISLEENTINTQVEIDVIKKRIVIQDQELSTKWSSQFQKDIKALYDVDTQSQVLSIMADQINYDLDGKIFGELLYAVENLNDPAIFQDTWSTVPSAGFALGEKAWLNTIVPYIERLSGNIYDATNIAEASVIVCNPRDHWIMKSLNEFSYDGAVATGGNYGPISGRVGNKYKVLVSKNVPKGKMLILMKEAEEVKATYYFAPYVPGLITPYPLGNTPSMTVLSRNGSLLVREKGIAMLNITNT